MIWNVKQEITPLENNLPKNNIMFLIKIFINVVFFIRIMIMYN